MNVTTGKHVGCGDMEFLVVLNQNFFIRAQIWRSGVESVYPHELSEITGLLVDREAGSSYISQLPGLMQRWVKQDGQAENPVLVFLQGDFKVLDFL